MTPIATDEIAAMPEPSNDKSSATVPVAANSGHRSPQRASAAEGAPQGLQNELQERARDGAPSTEVFAVYGVEPEIQAYAMAKYSRSSLSLKESLREISSQEAEKFLHHVRFT